MSTIRFVLENDGDNYHHLTTSEIEGNPYTGLPEFFQVGGSNRTDKEFESLKGGDGRYYIHSKLVDGKVRILVLYNPTRIGNKDILSETLETQCLKLVNSDYSNLNWWFHLEDLNYRTRIKYQ